MGEMHGVRRVITFCLLTAVLPTVLLVIPLYLRHSIYADVSYAVAESDVLEAVEGISTVFCQEQILRMNSTFRAFQLKQMPPLSNQKKHIQLKKSMLLPDDTVEYWGFYLLAGSNISLFACSRYEGAGVLVVKGEKNLKTCQSTEPQYKSVKYKKNSQSMRMIKNNIRENWESKFQGHKKESPPAQMKTDSHISQTSYNHSNSDREHTHSHERSSQTSNKAQGPKASALHSDINKSKNESDESVRHRKAVNLLIKQLQDVDEDSNMDSEDHVRQKRKNELFVPGHILDAGVGHGGNANVTEQPGESSDSSFEDSLRKCYDGQDILSKDIYPTSYCYNNYSLKHHKVHTIPISSDGYYYFMFYSDNDHFQNPLHAHFDIYKTTYQHTNFTRGCINQTECRFPITFWSSEIVIVEVPTHDGIEHEDGDASVLISSCYPRMSIYAIFPCVVLFLILVCAFL